MSTVTLVEALLLKSGFPAFRPSEELMDELKDLGLEERRGIYVHVLGGGTQFYVGLSIDVRSRYLQHLETYGSIEQSTFLHVPEPQDMAPIEMEHIALLREAGVTLLNVLQPAEDMSAEEVADMFDADKQQAWLDDMTAYYAGGPRDYDPQELPRFAKRHAELLAHKNYSEELIDILSYFIRSFIPTPDKSEGYLWTLNCLTNAFQRHPATALFRISVHRPEVLTVVVNDKDPDMKPFFLMFTVAKGDLAQIDLDALGDIADISFEEIDFKTAKFEHMRISAYTLDAVWRLFANPAFVRAIKRCVFELMRSGQTPKNFSQSHCLPLCAQVMSRKPVIPQRVGTAGRGTLAEVLADTELDSVWLNDEDYASLLVELFTRSVKGLNGASDALLAHSNRCTYRQQNLMGSIAGSLMVRSREMRAIFPDVWRAFYPLLVSASPPISSGASLAICGFRPVPKADPLLAVRDLLGLIKGAPSQISEGMSDEEKAEDNRFNHEGSILAGILHTGDERMIPHVLEAWGRLTRGARIRCFESWPPMASYAYLQFALDRLDESHDDQQLFVAIFNNLQNLPLQAHIRRIAEIEFAYGQDLEGLPVTVAEGSGSTYAEYAENSLKALKSIAKKETKPKLVPGLIKTWQMWDEDLTSAAEEE